MAQVLGFGDFSGVHSADEVTEYSTGMSSDSSRAHYAEYKEAHDELWPEYELTDFVVHDMDGNHIGIGEADERHAAAPTSLASTVSSHPVCGWPVT